MAGGAADDIRIYKEVVRLAGGAKKARIGILTSSSRPESQDPHAGSSRASNSKANAEHYVKLFREVGVKNVSWIPIDMDTIHNNKDPKVLKQIKGLNAVFFGGGDQSRYLTCLQDAKGGDSPALAAIRKTYHGSGMVIAGTSAGTAVQVKGKMVTGGESDHALTQKNVGKDASRGDLSFNAKGGLGFFTFGLLDTHFSERGRQGRMLRLAAETGARLSFGVDENTALVVTHPLSASPKMKVVGANGVQLFDLQQAKAKLGSEWRLSNVRASYLTHGDTYNYSKHKVAFAKWKISPKSKALRVKAKLIKDIFSSVDNRSDGRRKNPSSFAKVSAKLATSNTTSVITQAWGKNAVRVKLSKMRGTRGVKGKKLGVKARSYRNLRVDVRARVR